VGEPYDIDELFRLWWPVEFSQTTVDEHRRIANATQLHCCPECGLETFSPQIIGSPAFYVEAYNLAGTQSTSEFTYSVDKWDFDEAVIDAQGRKRIFEFGCGNGNFLSRIRNTASEVAGLEYNPAAVITAREKGLRVYSPDEGTHAFGNDWNAVFSFHVLEHVVDPVSFVRAMADTVKKEDGMIGISVPNQDGPISYIDPCVMNMPPHHATRWRLSTFEALAKRLNLVITRVAYEPLLLENHSYYSVYWVRKLLPQTSFAGKILRFCLSSMLRLFFGGLRRIGLKYFPLLKGQSIYVSMTHVK
jgi:2-polyprenyl-3-methyl-5-hydroxy-6-metoxy-1,4-benzoquinol methylase